MIDRAVEWAAMQIQRMRIRRQFRTLVGYKGDFENPRTYQEKVQFRKLYGNHEFYAMVTDKYLVRKYVAAKCGPQYLIPLLGVYDKLSPRIFDVLPQRFIIKANHGCKWNQIVWDKSTLDIAATVQRFNGLLTKRFGWEGAERHYNFINPKIVIEQLLQRDDGELPWDYNFFCYNSPQGFEYNFSVCSPQGTGAMFVGDWEVVDSKVPEQLLAPHLRPENFPEMVRVARDLSAEFDFVRVDLYSVAGRTLFGELTCTPHKGYDPIPNKRKQRLRDELWHLDARNPRLYHAPPTYRS